MDRSSGISRLNNNKSPSIHVCLHLVDFYGKLVGRYTRPMDTYGNHDISDIESHGCLQGGHSAVGVPLPFRAVTGTEAIRYKGMAWKTPLTPCGLGCSVADGQSDP